MSRGSEVCFLSIFYNFTGDEAYGSLVFNHFHIGPFEPLAPGLQDLPFTYNGMSTRKLAPGS